MKFVELKKHLAEGKLKPCYIVTGDDSFVVKKATEMLATTVGAYPELNLSHFTKDSPQSEILTALNSLPFLGERRVVFVENYTANLDAVKAYLEKPNPSSILVFVGALSQNLTAIIKGTEVIDCNRLDENFLATWVGAKITKAGCTTDKTTASKIVEYCSRDMSRIDAETDKLIAYANGNPIDEQTVEKLITPDMEFKVFELSEAIALKKRDKAVALAEKMLEENNSATMVFGLIFNHFRRLLHISLNPNSETLSADLKTKEYAVKMAMKQVNAYTPRRLKVIVDKLHEIDTIIKVNSTYAKMAIVSFVCETVLVG